MVADHQKEEEFNRRNRWQDIQVQVVSYADEKSKNYF